VHCHGGTEVVDFLTECFLREGVRKVPWPEFARQVEKRPFAAEALVALTKATTVRTAAILLDQYQGAFHAGIQGILEAWRRGDERRAAESLRELTGRCPLGRHLTSPWRVVIAGAPNVGKSSLLNALAGYHRAIVSTIPGTTRDLVSALLAIDGWPVEFTDTAGLRAEAGSLENQGMELARMAINSADLCLWVLDAGAAPVWPEQPLDTIRVIVNKNDLVPAWETSLKPAPLRLSAKTGEGVEALCRQISKWLVPAPPPFQAAVPFTDSLCTEIENFWDLCAKGHRDAAQSVLERICSFHRHGTLRH
jgi:tRNA modification GTPase